MRARWTALLIAGLTALDCVSLAQRADDSASIVSDRAAFYAAVQDNLARSQRAAIAFSYKERRTNLHTNPFGKIGTDGVELFQVYPSANPTLTYRRVLERDGVPVSAQNLAQQDREYRAKVAELRRLRDENEDDWRRRTEDDAVARRRAQAMIEDIVAALQFTITSQSLHEGRPSVVVTFAGKPAFRPKTREGAIAQKFQGTVWIDPEVNEVMHVEAMTTDDISFGFGIVARLNKGTTGSLTRRPVEPSLWMPAAVRLSGRGRAMLFLRKLALDFAIDWFDYQRFDGSVPVTP
jgi:hypothetical protein